MVDKDEIEMKVEESDEVLPLNEWAVGLCACQGVGCFYCMLAFVPCGDRLVAGLALSEMEGGGVCCFHTFCASLPISRAYMREVYGVHGSPGWDLCAGMCCRPCVATQMLSHVRVLGAAPNFPEVNPDLAANYGGLPAQCKECSCMDPCHMLHTLLCCQCESASHLAAATGLPMWLPICYSCYCYNHHIIRRNFGVPGSSMYNDCVEPFFCCWLGLQFVVVFPLIICCCYYTQMLENERMLIKRAAHDGMPRLLLGSSIGADIAAVGEQPAVDEQPGFDEERQAKISTLSSQRRPSGASCSTSTSGAGARRIDAEDPTPAEQLLDWVFPYALVGNFFSWLQRRAEAWHVLPPFLRDRSTSMSSRSTQAYVASESNMQDDADSISRMRRRSNSAPPPVDKPPTGQSGSVRRKPQHRPHDEEKQMS